MAFNVAVDGVISMRLGTGAGGGGGDGGLVGLSLPQEASTKRKTHPTIDMHRSGTLRTIRLPVVFASILWKYQLRPQSTLPSGSLDSRIGARGSGYVINPFDPGLELGACRHAQVRSTQVQDLKLEIRKRIRQRSVQ